MSSSKPKMVKPPLHPSSGKYEHQPHSRVCKIQPSKKDSVRSVIEEFKLNSETIGGLKEFGLNSEMLELNKCQPETIGELEEIRTNSETIGEIELPDYIRVLKDLTAVQGRVDSMKTMPPFKKPRTRREFVKKVRQDCQESLVIKSSIGDPSALSSSSEKTTILDPMKKNINAGEEFSTSGCQVLKEPKLFMFMPEEPESTNSTMLRLPTGESPQFLDPELERQRVSSNLAKMKHQRHEEKEEERHKGVSTKLKLFEDPWKSKVKLLHGTSGKVVLKMPLRFMKNHVLPFLNQSSLRDLNHEYHALFSVWDADTKTNHELFMYNVPHYCFYGDWEKDSVQRRNLNPGDTVGLDWDLEHSRFNFSVLARDKHQ